MINKSFASYRLLAQILDTGIYFGLFVLLNMPILLFLRLMNIDNAQINLFVLQLAVFFIFYLSLQTWQITKYGATFGYQIMKLKILNEDGSQLSWTMAMVRVLFRMLYYALSASTVLVFYHYIRVINTQGTKDPLDEIMHTIVVDNNNEKNK